MPDRDARALTLPLLAATLLVGAGATASSGEVWTATLRVRELPPASRAVRLASEDGTWAAEAKPVEGEAVIAGAPPGRYEVTWEGGPRHAIDLRPGEVVILDAASRRVLSRGALSWGTWFDAEALRALPVTDAWSLLETTEPVAVVDRLDTGGLFTGEPGRVNAHGGSWTETSFLLDGADVTDPRRGGRPLALPDLQGASGLLFVTAGAPVDVAGSGPVVSVLSAGVPARWSLSARGGAATGGSAPGLEPPPIHRLESWADAGLRAAGPMSSRWSLAVAASWTRSDRRAAEEVRPASRLATGGAEVVGRPSDSSLLRVHGALQDAVHPAFSPLFAETADRRLRAGASWDQRFPSGAQAGARATFASLRSEDAEGGRSLERLLDGPVAEAVAERGGGTRRAGLDLWWGAPPRRALGWHLLRAGGSVGATGVDADAFRRTVVEEVGGREARTWVYTSGEPRWSAREAALFAADRVVVGPVALEAGLRLDGAWARAEEGATISGLVWAPRASVRWSVAGPDRLVARGSWGRYAHRVPLEWLAHGDPRAPRAEVSSRGRLVARRGPGAPAGGLDGDLARPYSDELLLALESRLGPLHLTFAGIDRRGRNLVESANIALGPSSYTAVVVPDPAGDIVGPADDQLLPLFRRTSGAEDDLLLLTNAASHDTKFQAVEFTAALQAPGRGGLLLGLTAHRSEGNAAFRGFRSFENDPALVGALFDEPNADTFPYGRLFFDRAYTIKLSGHWRAPGDLRLGASARYQDGQPFARLVIDDDAPQGRDLVRAVPDGRHRFEYTLTVDARIEKGFTWGRARVGVVLEGFNLLGNRHVVEEDVTSGPGFRDPTLVQPPRVFRAGLRLDL